MPGPKCRRRPSRKAQMYAEAMRKKAAMYAEAMGMTAGAKGTTISINGRRVRAVDGIWHPDGKWMIVWDSANVPYIRKVACVLPAKMEVQFPVYAYNMDGSCGHSCWLHAGYIPAGMDVAGIAGYYDMEKDMAK